ncbi:MAG: dienelactone hydrolase family protein [Bryobacteraceae bacterium]|nr:dienelactone hydrolase family protein [Bryobacteraceae bacterium]MDW8380146.1 dienelactone hydrolase family protein [Bryobacterales bacterium]
MYESDNPIDQLVHLYIDGAFNRRELIKRVAQKTGSVAAAMSVLAGYEELKGAEPAPEQEQARAALRTPRDAFEIEASDIEFTGPASTLYAHLAKPRMGETKAAVLVVHENRGLVEHIKDVTRRAARGGFLALGVDLLSRQGGVQMFPDAMQQTQAYGRTNQADRRADLLAGFELLKSMGATKIGMTGFCAGGANTWDFAVHVSELAAAVPFYGAPPALEDVERIKAPVFAIYAERDRALTMRLFPVANEMIRLQKTFGMIVYEGVGHAFHNDTGAAYNGPAADDAWTRTLLWFDKFLLN